MGDSRHAVPPGAPPTDAAQAKDDLRDSQDRFGNAGRWGADDQLGALNLIDAPKRLNALSLPRYGNLYSLSHEFSAEGPHAAHRNPVWHITTKRVSTRGRRGSADDVIVCHSHVGTHIDGLSHYWGAGGLYNGVDESCIDATGASALSISGVRGILTRALVVDVSERCPHGQGGWGRVIDAEMIQAACSDAGLTIEGGDALLIHTGWSREFRADPDVYNWGEPGIDEEAADWLASRDVALVGADNWAVEAVPPARRGVGLPVHQLLLNRYGIYLLENLLLDEVTADRGSCVGLLVIAPLRIRGGVGSPVNPLLIT